MTVAAHAPFAITAVERLAGAAPERDAGAFDLAYSIKPRNGAPEQLDVRARITCRVRELALVVEPPPELLRCSAEENRLTTYFRADPFAAAPGDCETSFLYRGESVAKACLQKHAIVDGECADEPFVKRAVGIAMTESDLQLRDGTLVGDAVFTVDAERAGHAAWVRCEDGARVVPARGSTPVPALDGMAAGTSKHVQLTVDLAERLAVAPGRCELGLVVATEQVARFCLAGKRVDAGPCSPALGTR